MSKVFETSLVLLFLSCAKTFGADAVVYREIESPTSREKRLVAPQSHIEYMEVAGRKSGDVWNPRVTLIETSNGITSAWIRYILEFEHKNGDDGTLRGYTRLRIRFYDQFKNPIPSLDVTASVPRWRCFYGSRGKVIDKGYLPRRYFDVVVLVEASVAEVRSGDTGKCQPRFD